MAMHDGQKNVIEFDEVVKLQLYDASGHYVSKSVHTVISPSLCVPILLGLPFLKHNNIIIDIKVNTAIDKNNGFNLLNPSIPQKPKPKVQKSKFNYEFHANILKLCTQLLEELKAKLLHWKNEICSKYVQKIDVIVAVQVCLEQLAAEEQLNKMGAEVLKTYSAIFEFLSPVHTPTASLQTCTAELN